MIKINEIKLKNDNGIISIKASLIDDEEVYDTVESNDTENILFNNINEISRNTKLIFEFRGIIRLYGYISLIPGIHNLYLVSDVNEIKTVYFNKKLSKGIAEVLIKPYKPSYKNKKKNYYLNYTNEEIINEIPKLLQQSDENIIINNDEFRFLVSKSLLNDSIKNSLLSQINQEKNNSELYSIYKKILSK